MSSWTSAYFSTGEMACSHCGEEHMDSVFMGKLTRLREAYGKPLRVTSAYRCEEHPIEARKARPGAHASGQAVDLGVERGEAYELLRLAMESGDFTGIGIQQKGAGGRFIHLDDLDGDDGFPRPTIWSY